MLTTTIALLVAFSAPVQAGSHLPDPGQIRLVKDSAHTLFTPNAPDPGRVGQLYELPQGGLGVSTGGTSHYQTMVSPGGSAIAVPNGNNTYDMMGTAGHAGVGAPE
jgi:hypothetical protein